MLNIMRTKPQKEFLDVSKAEQRLEEGIRIN